MPEDLFETVHQEGRRTQRGCLLTFAGWLASLAWIFLGARLFREQQARWGWVTFAAWIVIIFIAPTIGIVLALDLKRYLDWRGTGSNRSPGFRFLIWLGSWLLALMCGLAGMAGIATAMSGEEKGGTPFSWGTVTGLLAFGFIFIALAVLFLLLPFKRLSAATEAEARAVLDADDDDWEAS